MNKKYLLLALLNGVILTIIEYIDYYLFHFNLHTGLLPIILGSNSVHLIFPVQIIIIIIELFLLRLNKIKIAKDWHFYVFSYLFFLIFLYAIAFVMILVRGY